MEKYILTFDRGNSSAKIALWNQAGKIACHLRSRSSSGRDECLALIREAASRAEIVSAAYASVVKDGANEAIVEALREASAPGARCIVLNASTPMPMTSVYSTPLTLGADRLAAALGALALYGTGRTLLVVDLGSAITYDIVDAEGRYLGGNIAPGVQARFRSLHEVAPALPLVEAESDLPLFGYSTETAIRAGVLRGIAAEITGYAAIAGERTLTLLTGGDACFFQAITAGLPDIEIRHNLIHHGLKRLLEYNETL